MPLFASGVIEVWSDALFNRISSILSINTSKSKEDLQRFLGMMIYVGNFIPNFFQETVLLSDLLKENSLLVWTTQDEDFKRLKILMLAPVLKFFLTQVNT